MPEFNIQQSIKTSMTAQEPWPDNVKLFQPYEVEQILLPDNASCLAVQAFLKMCNLPFEVEMRWNAEFMSPSGRVPFIKCGEFVVSELEPIAQFAANKGVSLCSRLTTEEKAEMRAYMSLITNVLVNAELYISWLDDETFNAVTKVRSSSVYPWPLGWLQTRAKRSAVAKRLKALHWHDKTLDQVLADVEQCCNSLSQRLGDRDYFFGTPTPLDALVYGHVRALLGAAGPRAARVIGPVPPALLAHMLRVAESVQAELTPQEERLVGRLRSPGLPRRALLGFKPFPSQLALTVSKDGSLSCGFEPPCTNQAIAEESFVDDFLEEVIDRVELAIESNDCEKDGFVVCNKSELGLASDYLDTIDENSTLPPDSETEDVIKIIDSEEEAVLDDAAGDQSSRKGASKPTSVAASEISPSGKTLASELGSPHTSLSGSMSSLKMPDYEEMSVHNLLAYLRKKNPDFRHFVDVADVD